MFQGETMSIDKDIAEFVAAIGAKAPSPGNENYAKWKAIFKRSNYFFFNGKFMIVKISRSKKPFWGGADKIACITSHFAPVIQAILQLNSALYYIRKNQVYFKMKLPAASGWGIEKT